MQSFKLGEFQQKFKHFYDSMQQMNLKALFFKYKLQKN